MVWMARSRRGLVATLLLALALIASVARGVLPTGYMVNAGLQPGEIAIVLCADHGRAPAALDLATGGLRPLDERPRPESRTTAADLPCVFAASALAAPPETGPSIATPAMAPGWTRGSRVRAIAVGRGLAAPPPPATGPPVSVA